MVNPNEIIYKAISHKETDFVPYHISIHERLRTALIKRYGKDYDRDIIDQFVFTGPSTRLFPSMGDKFPYANLSDIRKTKNNLSKAGFSPEYIEKFFAEPNVPWVDDFGCTWIQSQEGAPTVIKPALAKPDLKGYEFPDYSNPEFYGNISQEIDKNREKFIVAGAGILFYERAWAMRGFRQILIDFYRYPSFVENLLDKLMELNIQLVKKISKFSVDALMFSDDFGMQKGLIMGAPLWRKFLKPRLRQIYGATKKEGKLIMIHSCGDNSEIIGDLIEIGVDIFNPTQPEAMDIFKLKKDYGSKIVFDGGLPSQKLPFLTPKEIRDEVSKVRSIMSKGGGFILSPTKEIRWDTPLHLAYTLIKEITQPSVHQSVG